MIDLTATLMNQPVLETITTGVDMQTLMDNVRVTQSRLDSVHQVEATKCCMLIDEPTFVDLKHYNELWAENLIDTDDGPTINGMHVVCVSGKRVPAGVIEFRQFVTGEF